MRRLVHTLLLAVAACAVADATFGRYRQAPVQSVLQPVVPFPQGYSYYLSPGQRYIYLNGLPYAVLGEQLQYLPAAGASPYAAQGGQLSFAPPADSVNVAAAPANTIQAQVGTPASEPPASAYGAVNTVDPAASTAQDASVYAAPAPAPVPPPAPAPEPIPAPDTELVPTLTPEPSPAPASTPERGLPETPEPEAASVPAAESTVAASAAAPEAAATVYSAAQPSQTTTTVYLSGASQPSQTGQVYLSEASQPGLPAAQPSQTSQVYLSSASQPSLPASQPSQAGQVYLSTASQPTQAGQVYLSTASQPSLPVAQPSQTTPTVYLSGPSQPSQTSQVYLSAASQPSLPATQPSQMYLNVASQPSQSSQVYMSTASQPSLPATQPSQMYLSAASQPSLPVAQRVVRLTVSNPKVTVHRKVSEYSWQHPAQSLDGPVQIVFYNDKKVEVVPSSPQQSDSKSLKLQFDGIASSANPQPSVVQSNALDDLPSRPTAYSPTQASAYSPTQASAYSPTQASPTAADLMGITLSQSPLLRVYVDPATHTSYFLDSQGRRVDLPASAPSAAPVPLPPATHQYQQTAAYTPYSGASPTPPAPAPAGPAATYYGAASGLPAQAASGISERFKAQDMTGLRPLESLYAPATFNGPAPQPTSYDKPLTLSISTGKEAESSAGPPSPLSPGDSGPSRGDSVENLAKPRPLWPDRSR